MDWPSDVVNFDLKHVETPIDDHGMCEDPGPQGQTHHYLWGLIRFSAF